MPPKAAASAKTAGLPTEAARTLQERLHELISRLSSTSDLVKTWPAAPSDNATSVHVEQTTKIMGSVRKVLASLEKVEATIQTEHPVLKRTLQETLVPLDLLDLLDHGGGLNPDCFSRGLVKEALGQLAGLKRRKLALEMLGAAVQSGINQKKKQEAAAAASTVSPKREREQETDAEASRDIEPPTKKQK